MLPFPIMSTYDNLVDNSVLLDIDFSSHEIGSSILIDKRGTYFSPSGSGVASVQVDNNKGKVMTFSPPVSFIASMNNTLSLSNKHFKLQIVFKSTIASENMVFSTGDYYGTSQIIGGMLLNLYNVTGSQLFCTTNSGVFTRCTFPYTANTWRDLTFEWVPETKIMTITDNDTNTVLGTYNIPGGFGDGDYFCIGASYVRGASASFSGSIQLMKIIQLGE